MIENSTYTSTPSSHLRYDWCLATVSKHALWPYEINSVSDKSDRLRLHMRHRTENERRSTRVKCLTNSNWCGAGKSAAAFRLTPSGKSRGKRGATNNANNEWGKCLSVVQSQSSSIPQKPRDGEGGATTTSWPCSFVTWARHSTMC